MWAACHSDTWAFPRKPAKSSECRWVITFGSSLTTVQHKLQAFITVVCVQSSFPSSIGCHGIVYLVWECIFLLLIPSASVFIVLCCCQDLDLWGILNWWDSPLLLLWQWPPTEHFWPHWLYRIQTFVKEKVKHMCNSLSKQNHRTLCSPGEVKLSRQQSTNLPWNPADIHGAQGIYPRGRHLWFWSELVKQLFSWLPWNLVSTSELIVKTLLITYVKFTYYFQFLLLFG